MTASIPTLQFVTSNPHKAAEVESLLGISVCRIDVHLPEIQAASIEEIIEAKLNQACRHASPPLAVEDVSLEIEALGGFPGPYIRWLLECAGGEGLAAIVASLPSRAATARCGVGLWDGEEIHFVEGAVRGEILTRPRGSRNFGWDAWFLPAESRHTYGEMTPEEKSEHSHRALAWNEARKILIRRSREREGGLRETPR